MEKVIDITAKRDGFRRAGMVHSEQTQTYPLSQFTKEQIRQLQEEPMLVVAIRNANEQQAGATDEITQQQLKALTAELDGAKLQIQTLTGQLTEAQENYQSVMAMHEDVKAEAARQLEEERQNVSNLTTELEGERQKVADLTTQLEAATKKGK
ncbi:HI1506-related protein [Enterobacter asburiae]